MRIRGYIWCEEIVEKLWWKHHVTVEEVQEVLANRPRVERIEKGHHKGEDVYVASGQTDTGRYLSVAGGAQAASKAALVASGQTDTGRYLTVVFIYKLDHRALIITARDMSPKERRRYGR